MHAIYRCTQSALSSCVLILAYLFLIICGTCSAYNNGEPEVLGSPDTFVRELGDTDLEMKCATIEKGIIFVGPRTGIKYKVKFNYLGQQVQFTDRHNGISGLHSFDQKPNYLITSPYSTALYEYKKMPRSGVYKDQRTGNEYIIATKKEYEELKSRKQVIEYNAALSSDQGLPRVEPLAIGSKITVNDSITGTLKARTLDTITVSIESKVAPGNFFNRTIEWEKVNESQLESLMPERYETNMLEIGVLSWQGCWYAKDKVERLQLVKLMTDKGLVEYEGEWLAPNEITNKIMAARGMVVYNGDWVTPEGLTNNLMLAQGLFKYEGEWLAPIEMTNRIMKTRGMVVYNGDWVTPAELKNILMREEGFVNYDGRWLRPDEIPEKNTVVETPVSSYNSYVIDRRNTESSFKPDVTPKRSAVAEKLSSSFDSFKHSWNSFWASDNGQLTKNLIIIGAIRGLEYIGSKQSSGGTSQNTESWRSPEYGGAYEYRAEEASSYTPPTDGSGSTITTPGRTPTYVNPTHMVPGGSTITTPGRTPTYVNPTPGVSGGSTITTPGRSPTYVNPTPFVPGGSTITTPGRTPTYVNPTHMVPGGSTITTPGRTPTYVNPTPGVSGGSTITTPGGPTRYVNPTP